MKWGIQLWHCIGNHRLTAVVLVALIVALPWLGPLLDPYGLMEVRADVVQIAEADEEGYLYKYEATTFEMLAGEENEESGKPSFTVRQGMRELDIIVVSNNTLPIEQVQESLIEPELFVDEEMVAGEAAPSPTPDAGENSISSLRRFFAQSAWARQRVEVVGQETQPAIDYEESGVTLTPTLDRVKLDIEVASPDAMPNLQVRTDSLAPVGKGDSVSWQTRTNRKSFALEGAKIVDGNGAESTVTLAWLGQVTSSNEEIQKREREYTISFDVPNRWLHDSDRVAPVHLEVELVSLFHDRMLPARPLQRDFKATDNLMVEIDKNAITDEVVKQALESDELPFLRFGLIDVFGNTAQLSAKVVSRQEAIVTVELASLGAEIKGGIFDLLIQYGEDPAYIGLEDFSWGVLVINPDQSVYQPGSEARIDMAVLDKLGKMVCDARLTLDIEDPEGGVTVLSTVDGSIEVTGGCFEKVTSLPDYTTSYRTAGEGIYSLTLNGVTDAGQFTIKDSFSVDSSAPYYVKRRGPTRVFPLAEYEMELLVTAGQAASRIEETVPEGFMLAALDGGVVEENSGVLGQKVVWNEPIEAGIVRTVRYRFDTPDKSPALYLVGPVKVNDWQEQRQWQIANDDTTSARSPTASQNNATWTNENNMHTQNNTYADGDMGDSVDQITFGFTASDIPDGATIGGVTVEIDAYKDSTRNNSIQANLLNSGTCTQQETGLLPTSDTDTYQTLGGSTDTWSCTALTDTAIKNSAFGVSVTGDKVSGANPVAGTYHVDHVQVTVEYTTGPATEDIMAHGNYFSGGTEQSFFWAD